MTKGDGDALDWERAEQWLNEVISEYEALGPVGVFGLLAVLLPLRGRLISGERTQDLYDRIMECE